MIPQPVNIFFVGIILLTCSCKGPEQVVQKSYTGSYKTNEITIKNVDDSSIVINGQTTRISKKIIYHIRVNNKTIEFGHQMAGLTGDGLSKKIHESTRGVKETIDKEPRYFKAYTYEVIDDSGQTELRINLNDNSHKILIIRNNTINFEGNAYVKE